MYDDDRAARQSRKLLTHLDETLVDSPDAYGVHALRLMTCQLLAASLQRLGQPLDAVTIARDGIERSKSSLKDYDDNRCAVESLAIVKRQLGSSLSELGMHAEAEEALRESRKLLRSTFNFDGTPKEFSDAYMQSKVSHSLFHPKAFAEYAISQSKLAAVLRDTGQADEGYELASEAVHTCLLLSALYPGEPSNYELATELTVELARFELSADDDQQRQQSKLIEKIITLAQEQSANFESLALTAARAELYYEFSRLLDRSGRTAEAIGAWKAAIELQQRAVEGNSSSIYLADQLLKYRAILEDHH